MCNFSTQEIFILHKSTGKIDFSEQLRFSSLSYLYFRKCCPLTLSIVFDDNNRFSSRFQFFFFFGCQPVCCLNFIHNQACHDTNPCKSEQKNINRNDQLEIIRMKNLPEITKTDNDEFEFISSDSIIAETNSGESNH